MGTEDGMQSAASTRCSAWGGKSRALSNWQAVKGGAGSDAANEAEATAAATATPGPLLARPAKTHGGARPARASAYRHGEPSSSWATIVRRA